MLKIFLRKTFATPQARLWATSRIGPKKPLQFVLGYDLPKSTFAARCGQRRLKDSTVSRSIWSRARSRSVGWVKPSRRTRWTSGWRNVRVRLRGVNRSVKRLADRRFVTYWYYGRGKGAIRLE